MHAVGLHALPCLTWVMVGVKVTHVGQQAFVHLLHHNAVAPKATSMAFTLELWLLISVGIQKNEKSCKNCSSLVIWRSKSAHVATSECLDTNTVLNTKANPKCLTECLQRHAVAQPSRVAACLCTQSIRHVWICIGVQESIACA